MHNDIKNVILSNKKIKSISKKIGKQITLDYKGKDLLLVCLLKGGVPFLSSLMMNIDLPLSLDFIQASSYHGGMVSTCDVIIKKDLDEDVKGKDILIVEDIVDTGFTLSKIMDIFKDKGASSVEIACLLDKPSGRKVEGLTPKYIGQKIDNLFVVGFGLDYDEKYRNLNYIGVLKEEVYKK